MTGSLTAASVQLVGESLAGLLAAAAVLVRLGPDRRRRLRTALGRDGPGRTDGGGRGLRGRGVRGRASDRRPAVPAAVLLDLVAEVLAGGAPVTRAVSAVGESLRAVDDPHAASLLALAARLATGPAVPVPLRAPAGGPSPGASAGPSSGRTGGVRSRSGSPAGRGTAVARLAEALDLAVVTGSSPVCLLRAAAQEERRAAAARGVRAARRLGVLVLLPTGLCLLPAFLLLTVVPMAVGLALG